MLRDGVDELLPEVNKRHGTDFSVRRAFRAAVNSGAFLVEGAERICYMHESGPGEKDMACTGS